MILNCFKFNAIVPWSAFLFLLLEALVFDGTYFCSVIDRSPIVNIILKFKQNVNFFLNQIQSMKVELTCP